MHASKRVFLSRVSGLSLSLVFGVGLGTLPWTSTQAASWPTQPLRLIVGFPPGSSPDTTARILAEPLSQALGQPVMVDNKPGAAGNIAASAVARATDDHTLGVVINGNLTSSKMLYPKLPYDPAKDFSYLSMLTKAPLVLVATAKGPGGAAFFEAARQAGDRWNYGSVGVGSLAHLGMELLKTRSPGLKAIHVPYPGTPQVITGLLGDQVQMALIAPSVALPQVQAGKVRAIGLTSGRSTLAPSIPSLAEVGIPDFNLEVWNALIGPANLSAAAQTRLQQALTQIMRSPQVRQKLFDMGWQVVGSTPEGMRLRVQAEAAQMQRIISTQGIRLE